LVAPVVWHVVAFAPFGVAVAVCDWRTFLIPDRWVVAGAVAVVGARVAWPAGAWWALVVAVAAASGLFALARWVAAGKMGWGDVKLSGLVALALGGFGWLVAMLIACVTALVWVAVAHWGVVREARIPFGSFMVVGAMVAGLVLALVPLDGGYVV
jgi:leader peptidase (prepilin peptidase)/N-methyltransferase